MLQTLYTKLILKGGSGGDIKWKAKIKPTSYFIRSFVLVVFNSGSITAFYFILITRWKIIHTQYVSPWATAYGAYIKEWHWLMIKLFSAWFLQNWCEPEFRTSHGSTYCVERTKCDVLRRLKKTFSCHVCLSELTAWLPGWRGSMKKNSTSA